MKYYRMSFDWGYEGGWTLGELQNYGEDEWVFVRGGEVRQELPDLSLEIICAKGQDKDDYDPLDLTLIPSISALEGSDKARSLLNPKDVQAIPVRIRNAKQPIHYIFPIIHTYDCIDYEKSNVEYWKEGNTIRPDLAGKIRGFNKLVIDPFKVGDASVFRLSEEYLVIIVREDLVNKIQKHLKKDLKFTLV